MSLQTQHLLEFGEFRLDLDERRLQRGDAVISITPKVFETLQVLVENAGHLVEKDELMQRIWQDRFVEESNLAFNIKMLRKALGDDAAKPRFIETVPRRGYRFIAEVGKRLGEKESQNGRPPSVSPSVENAENNAPRRTFLRLSLLAVVCLVAVGAAGWWWYAGNGRLQSRAPILSAPFSSENLSTNGRVGQVVVSPDGENVAYTNGLGSDKQSVWLRQLDTSNNVQIIPPSDEFYYNLTFSPDGNFLYFVRGARPGIPVQYTLYRVSIFGGIATKLVGELQGWISISRDGTKLSFVRCYHLQDESCSLWIADADGKNERKLISRAAPLRIGDNAISPDGRKIAFGAGQSLDASNAFGVYEVDIETGDERELSKEKFFNFHNIVWLPDQDRLLLTALKFPDKHFRIWSLSAKTGEAVDVTKTPQDYYKLSLDQDADTLVATQGRPDFYLNLYGANDLTKARRVLSDAASVSFSPDGNLVVSSGRPGNLDLWRIDPNGGAERQLTNDPLDDFGGIVSSDGTTVFFSSNRTDAVQVWRMRSDGSDQRQLTLIEGGNPLGLSPDGKWLYYHAALARNLRRVSVADGVEQAVVSNSKRAFAVSPDCSRVAFTERAGKDATLVIASLDDGRTLNSFPISSGVADIAGMSWSPDGNTLYYIAAINDYEDNTLWAQPMGQATPKKIADLPDEGLFSSRSFAVAPDGNSFAIVQGTWKHDAVLIKGLK